MKLVIYENENDIDISGDWISVLEIENKKLFAYNVRSLYNQVNGIGDVKNIHVYDEDEELDFKKSIFYISDPFNINFNDRRVFSALQKKLEKIREIEVEKWNNIEEIYIEFYGNLVNFINEIDMDIETSTGITISKIMKLLDIKIYTKNEFTYLDNLIQLMDVICELDISDIIVFINLKSYLDYADLQEFYKYVIYKNVRILLVESSLSIENSKYEQKLVIDKDFDEYVLS